MSEEKINSVKEALLEFSKMQTFAEIERTTMRNGANAINYLQQKIDKAIEFFKEYHNYENRFKWCEQDYIDTINRAESILQGKEME